LKIDIPGLRRPKSLSMYKSLERFFVESGIADGNPIKYLLFALVPLNLQLLPELWFAVVLSQDDGSQSQYLLGGEFDQLGGIYLVLSARQLDAVGED
jgi:hypothetical protein